MQDLKELMVFDVQFLTGTDEHGLKNSKRSAEKENIEPLEFCNQISKTFKRSIPNFESNKYRFY